MEWAEYMRFVLALAFVIGMIWVLMVIMKRTGMDKRLRGVTGQHGRLSVVDVLYLDPRRKLTIVRADGREYLILIAGERATLIDKLEGKTDAATA